MRFSLWIYKDFGHLKISINLLILVFAALAFITGTLPEYFLTLLSITLHEAGHATTAILSGGKIYNVRVMPVGLNAEMDNGYCSKLNRLIIYFAGPLVSFSLAGILKVLIHMGFTNPYVSVGLYTNLYLAFFNMLPVFPLDGGRIFVELAAAKFGLIRAGKRMKQVSVLLSVIIIAVGLVSLFTDKKRSVSLIIIGVYIYMYLGANKEETALMNIKSLLFRKARVTRKGIYPVREIVVLKTVKLAEVIKAMDYVDRFHIVNILDENLRVIMVMTEQEIIDAVVRNTPDTTFENLMHIEYNVHNEVN